MTRRPASSSSPEVTDVLTRGLWLLVDERERFLPYAKFPWFRDAESREVLEVEREGEDHLRWPALDVARRRANTGRRRGK